MTTMQRASATPVGPSAARADQQVRLLPAASDWKEEVMDKEKVRKGMLLRLVLILLVALLAWDSITDAWWASFSFWCLVAILGIRFLGVVFGLWFTSRMLAMPDRDLEVIEAPRMEVCDMKEAFVNESYFVAIEVAMAILVTVL